MEQSKKEFLPVLQGVKLSKTQSRPRQKIERMKVIPYASTIGSIKYAMLCTKPVVYLAMSLSRRYLSDLRVDHWTAVKIILWYLPTILIARHTSGLVHSIAYMIEHMAEA